MVALTTLRHSTVVAAPVLAAVMLLSVSACAPATTATSGVSAPTSGGSSNSSNSGSTSGSSAKDIDACKLVSAATAGTDLGASYESATSSTIAPGQDQCAYATSDDSQALVVIVYQPNSGVTWSMLQSVQAGAGSIATVSGVGDKAILGSIELDVQTGTHFIAIEGGIVSQNATGAESLAKAEISALG